MNKVKHFIIGLLIIVSAGLLVPTQQALANENKSYSEALIYFNEACSGCSDYLYSELSPLFEEYEFDNVQFRDYVNQPEYRKDMNTLFKDLDLPFQLESHIMVFIGDELTNNDDINSKDIKVVLAGHIPEDTTRFLLSKDSLEEDERYLVFQDKMPNMETVEDYKAWGFSGPVKTYEIDEEITTYVNWFRENKEDFVPQKQDPWAKQKLLLTIIITGFFDGLNPCAIAVLLLFISYLFTLQKARKGILKMGIVYIAAVYLAYILIGFGLLKAVLISTVPHFMAWVGSILVIALGLLNVVNYLAPNFPIKLKIPDFTKGVISEYLYKGTIPAAAILGFVVGLCTFPCSGGPYVAIITMLSSQTDFGVGLSYLLIYNLFFVSPLIIILLLSGNKHSAKKLLMWEASNSKWMHLISGLLMISIGLIIIFFFI